MPRRTRDACDTVTHTLAPEAVTSIGVCAKLSPDLPLPLLLLLLWQKSLGLLQLLSWL